MRAPSAIAEILPGGDLHSFLARDIVAEWGPVCGEPVSERHGCRDGGSEIRRGGGRIQDIAHTITAWP